MKAIAKMVLSAQNCLALRCSHTTVLTQTRPLLGRTLPACNKEAAFGFSAAASTSKAGLSPGSRWERDRRKLPKMSSLFVRTVAIEIANKTRNVTLHTPRSYCYSGYNHIPPAPQIPPGATESCQFANRALSFRGSVGVLVYEADAFTLAILFSNPYDYNIFPMEIALEICVRKAHLGNLQDVYNRMYNSPPTRSVTDTTFQRASLQEYQETLVVSTNDVKVMATMSTSNDAVVKVIVEDKGGSSVLYSEHTLPRRFGPERPRTKNWKDMNQGKTGR